MEEFASRPMEAQDISGASAIEASVPDGWSERGVADALSSPARRCFIAHDARGAAGFCACTLAGGEANIDAVSVRADARRKGIGEGLLRTALRALKEEGASEVFLEVRSQNTPAVRLYEKLGFAPVGVRRGFYKDPPDDAVVMKKEL